MTNFFSESAEQAFSTIIATSFGVLVFYYQALRTQALL